LLLSSILLLQPKANQDKAQGCLCSAQLAGEESYQGADGHRDEDRKEAHEEEISLSKIISLKIFWPMMYAVSRQ